MVKALHYNRFGPRKSCRPCVLLVIQREQRGSHKHSLGDLMSAFKTYRKQELWLKCISCCDALNWFWIGAFSDFLRMSFYWIELMWENTTTYTTSVVISHLPCEQCNRTKRISCFPVSIIFLRMQVRVFYPVSSFSTYFHILLSFSLSNWLFRRNKVFKWFLMPLFLQHNQRLANKNSQCCTVLH